MPYLLPFYVNGNRDKTVCSLNIDRRALSLHHPASQGSLRRH